MNQKMAWCVFWKGKCQAVCAENFFTAHDMAAFIEQGADRFELLPKDKAKEILEI